MYVQCFTDSIISYPNNIKEHVIAYLVKIKFVSIKSYYNVVSPNDHPHL
jgi:hypothetical protein